MPFLPTKSFLLKNLNTWQISLRCLTKRINVKKKSINLIAPHISSSKFADLDNFTTVQVLTLCTLIDQSSLVVHWHFPHSQSQHSSLTCAVQCSAVQCSAVQCSAVQCSAVQLGAVRTSALHCCAMKTL